MTKTALLLTSLITLEFAAGVVSCGEAEGPAERAGKQIDSAAAEARGKINELVNQEGPAEQLGRHIDHTAEEARERIKQISEEEVSRSRAERRIEEAVKETRARLGEVVERTEQLVIEREGRRSLE